MPYSLVDAIDVSVEHNETVRIQGEMQPGYETIRARKWVEVKVKLSL